MHLLHKLLDVAAGNRHGSPENDDRDYPKNDFNRAGLAIVELGEMLSFPKGHGSAP